MSPFHNTKLSHFFHSFVTHTLAVKNINFAYRCNNYETLPFLLDDVYQRPKYDKYIGLHSKWFSADSEQRTGTRVKDRTKNNASKRTGMGWGRMVRKHLQINPGILKNCPLSLLCLVAHTTIRCCHQLS